MKRQASNWGMVFSVLSCGVNAWGASSLSVGIPCINSTIPAEIAAQKLSGPHAGQRTCALVRPEVLQKLQERVKQQADCYYDGWQLNPNAPANPASANCPGTAIPKETCNLLNNGVPGVFNQNIVEKDTNHLGASCGDWPIFNARFVAGSGFDDSRCYVTPNYSGSTHLIEDSYNRGAWIQALNCFYYQVKLEVERNGSVQITPGGPCAALQQDIQGLASQFNGVASSLASQKNITDIENCTGNEASNIQALNPDVGKLRQSACYLLAARAALETLFTQVAACEVFSRAGDSYVRFLGGTISGSSVTQAARSAINGLVSDQQSQCDSGVILNQQYKPRYYDLFNSMANSIWNSQSCGLPGLSAP